MIRLDRKFGICSLLALSLLTQQTKSIDYSPLIFGSIGISIAILTPYAAKLYAHLNRPCDKSKLKDLAQRFRYKQYVKCEYLKNVFNIPDSAWKKCIETIELKKQFNKNAGLKIPTQNVIHDNSLPRSLLNTTKKLLQQNSINPACVNIIGNNGITEPSLHHQHNNFVTIAAAQSPNLTMQYLMQNNRIVQTTIHQTTPATIFLNVPELQKFSLDHQKATIAHEITHLTEDHPTEYNGILSMLQKRGHDIDSVQKHPAWLAYSREIETNANVLAACKNAHVARCIKSAYAQQCAINPAAQYTHRITHPAPHTVYVHLCEICKCHTG